MNANESNLEIFEKLCVIFQRVTYHSSLTGNTSKIFPIDNFAAGKVTESYLELFRMKLAEAERSDEMEFLASNLRSILTNLHAL